MYQKVTCGHTQPTTEEVSQMVSETYRLIDTFRPLTRLQQMINDKLVELGADESMQIKKQSGRNNSIYNWRANGRIPYHYVDVLVRIDDVKNAGFTRESLRPDVKAWHLK
jgi:hypothetical protein